jgi:hypothetical protein
VLQQAELQTRTPGSVQAMWAQQPLVQAKARANQAKQGRMVFL